MRVSPLIDVVLSAFPRSIGRASRPPHGQARSHARPPRTGNAGFSALPQSAAHATGKSQMRHPFLHARAASGHARLPVPRAAVYSPADTPPSRVGFSPRGAHLAGVLPSPCGTRRVSAFPSRGAPESAPLPAPQHTVHGRTRCNVPASRSRRSGILPLTAPGPPALLFMAWDGTPLAPSFTARGGRPPRAAHLSCRSPRRRSCCRIPRVPDTPE